MNIIPKFLQIETTASTEHLELNPEGRPDFDIGPNTTERANSDIIHPRGNRDETINFLQALSTNVPETLPPPPSLPRDIPIQLSTRRPIATGNPITIRPIDDLITRSSAQADFLPFEPTGLGSAEPAIMSDMVNEVSPETPSAPPPKISPPEAMLETMPATPTEIIHEIPSIPSQNMEPTILQDEAPDTIVSVRLALSTGVPMSPDNASPNIPIAAPSTAHKDTYLKSPQPQNPLPVFFKPTEPQIDSQNDISSTVKSAGTLPIAKVEPSEAPKAPAIKAAPEIQMAEIQMDVEPPKVPSGDVRLTDPKIISAISFLAPSALAIAPAAPDSTNAENSKPLANTPIIPPNNVTDIPANIETTTSKAVETAIKKPDTIPHIAMAPTAVIAENAEAPITSLKDTRHVPPTTEKSDSLPRTPINITAIEIPKITTELLMQTTLVTHPTADIPVKAIPTLQPTHNSPIHPAVQTVVQTLIKAQETQSGLSVRLDPPEMGRVFIEFQFDVDRRVTAIIRSEVVETAILLKGKVDIFQQLLKESGFDSVNLSFEQNENSKQKSFAFAQQEKPPVFFRSDHDEDHLSGAAPVPAQSYKLSPGTHIDIKL